MLMAFLCVELYRMKIQIQLYLVANGFCGETLLKNYSEWHTQEVLQLNENCSNTSEDQVNCVHVPRWTALEVWGIG